SAACVTAAPYVGNVRANEDTQRADTADGLRLVSMRCPRCPGWERLGVPLLRCYPPALHLGEPRCASVGRLECSRRTRTRAGTKTRRSAKNVHGGSSRGAAVDGSALGLDLGQAPSYGLRRASRDVFAVASVPSILTNIALALSLSLTASFLSDATPPGVRS